MTNKSKTCIVIDDEKGIHVAAADALKQLGYKCVSCTSGEEAMKRLEVETFDFALLDLLMPGMSGLQVLKQLRQLKFPFCNVPVFVITGVANDEILNKATELGALDVITKPFTAESITKAVNGMTTFSVGYQDLQKFFSSPRTEDKTLYREAGLTRINPAENKLYPWLEKDRHLCIAVNKAYPFASYVTMEQAQLQENAKVFLKLENYWHGIWPKPKDIAR